MCEIGRTEQSLESKGRMEERYKTGDVQNTFQSCSNKRFLDLFKSQNIIFFLVRNRIGEDPLITCVMFVYVIPLKPNQNLLNAYLAFATHSMMASFLPTVTVVFFGAMMMEGAMGSAGPPTSITYTETEEKKKVKAIYNSRICCDLASASA